MNDPGDEDPVRYLEVDADTYEKLEWIARDRSVPLERVVEMLANADLAKQAEINAQLRTLEPPPRSLLQRDLHHSQGVDVAEVLAAAERDREGGE